MLTPDLQPYWQHYLDTLPVENRPIKVDAWGFGDSPQMADELGALVVAGVKTATAGLLWDYEAENEALPTVGDYSIILNGANQPLCIIRITEVLVTPYNRVDERQAYDEGEGDRTLAYWREVHWKFFSRSCDAIGRNPDETMPVVCMHFVRVFTH